MPQSKRAKKRREKKRQEEKRQKPILTVPTAIRMGIVADPTIPVSKEPEVHSAGSGLNAIRLIKNTERQLPIL